MDLFCRKLKISFDSLTPPGPSCPRSKNSKHKNMNALLPLLTIDVEVSVRPAGSHPEILDAGDRHDSPLPFRLTEADISPTCPRPNRGNIFSTIPGDSELRDLARVTPDEFKK